MELIICCDAMREAQNNGSDNEEYGAVLRLGSVRATVKWCPWCGVEIAPQA